MFIHAFKYRLKILLHNKALIFWTLFFPIILGTFFKLSLSQMGKTEGFEPINIAVVSNNEYSDNLSFKEAIETVSLPTKEDRLFDLQLLDQEQADEALKNEDIIAYILLDDEINLHVKESGLSQTIVKSFLDTYVQTNSAIINIFTINPSAGQEAIQILTLEKTHTAQKVTHSTDIFIHYFYTLIAMACLYTATWGTKEVNDIQANMSTQAARLNMAPLHKLKIFLAGILAALLIAYTELLVLIAYIHYILEINMSSNIGLLLLTTFIGAVAGISFGALIGSISKARQNAKISIVVSLTMLQSFLAGMMIVEIKYFIKVNIPILSYLNPANLLTDAYYYLFNYPTLNSYLTVVGVLAGFIVVFLFLSYLILRRQKYVSL